MRHLSSPGRRRLLRQALAVPLTTRLAGGPFAALAESTVWHRRMRLNLGFRNPHAYRLSAQRFWCYLPVGPTATQRLTAVQVSTEYRLLQDRLAHNILELGFDSFSAYAHKQIHVTCEAELRATVEAGSVAGNEDWLRPEAYVESDDPAIRQQAETLRRESPAASARAIYDWVRSNLTYAGYIAPDLGARYALEARRGDCTEFAGLVVALARALGIPARVIGGYVTEQDLVLRANAYHNWAEILFDGAWRILDAQKGNWCASPQIYVGFRIHHHDPVNVLGTAHRYRIEGEILVEIGT
ncbi:MAG: transglutaminase-like domain-containing protein [Candidatus Accumulibacter sp.]|jgi:transglutaminase-like putative cysteine protease|nr:transglutaminase-like domain-containing protein [Accumulibacter sp.]